MSERLQELREKIDAIDAQIIDLLGARFALTREVGHLKANDGLPPMDPEREATQMNRITDLATLAQVPEQLARNTWSSIIEEVKREHAQTRRMCDAQ